MENNSVDRFGAIHWDALSNDTLNLIQEKVGAELHRRQRLKRYCQTKSA